MRTIAIMNQKGGSGKTTTAVNLGGCLAAEGARVLVVDMDPQAHATQALGVDPELPAPGLYEVLAEPGGGHLLKRAILDVSERLDLAPSSPVLGAVEQKLAGLNDTRRTERLALALSDVEARYEYALIDCPPAVGPLTFCALRAAREAIVPVETSCLSIEGIGRLLETVDLLCDRIQHRVAIRVLPTQFDGRTRFARRMLSEIRERFDDRCLDAVIRSNVKLREATERGIPVVRYAPRASGSLDHLSLAVEVQATPFGEVDRHRREGAAACRLPPPLPPSSARRSIGPK